MDDEIDTFYTSLNETCEIKITIDEEEFLKANIDHDLDV
jgi:regulation of enolase protein 1 (concanavalin A-like superfamily)